MARDVKEKLYEIDSKKIELDFLKQQFLVEYKRFAAQCIERTVLKAISSHPEQALSLGVEGLTPIKAEISSMTDTISDQVDEIVNQPQVWGHTQEKLVSDNFITDQYRLKGDQGPEILEQAIRTILAPVGELLLENKLDSQENWETVDNQLRYRHPLAWGREMSHCIEQYNDRFNELAKLVREYEALAEQSSGNDALDLWESI